MTGDGFKISGLRHRFFVLKRRWGVKRYYSFFGILTIVVLMAITLPLVLIINNEESNAAGAEKVVEIKFLNTQTSAALGKYKEDDNKGHKKGQRIEYNGNEANLIKTKDGKYVLIDTAEKGALDIIYNTLYDWQNGGIKGKVTIDYMIITHMHADHYGNAVSILSNKKFDVKNLVIKYAVFSDQTGKAKVFDKIVWAAIDKGVNIYTNSENHVAIKRDSDNKEVDRITMKDYDKRIKMNEEGTGTAAIEVGSYLKLYFYNTGNVYKRGTCVTGYNTIWYSYTDKTIKRKLTRNNLNRYMSFKNNTTKIPIEEVGYDFVENLTKSNGVFEEDYFYAGFTNSPVSNCNENGDSYGILAEIKFDTKSKFEDKAANKRYVYFANDLENTGYEIEPTRKKITYYDAVSGTNKTIKNYTIYGSGAGELYKEPRLGSGIIAASRDVVYSESKVALEVESRIRANNSADNPLNKLVIYQQSHHGLNNAPDALEKLKLNRKEVYAIVNRRNSFDEDYTIPRFVFQRSKYYLKKAKNMFTGWAGDGVYCYINSNGNYGCGYNGRLSYDMEGGSPSIAAQTCSLDKNLTCKIKVSDAEPSRDGYSFWGWSDDVKNQYRRGDNVEVKKIEKVNRGAEVALHAVWKPIYTLSYDLNGGNGAVGAQTCSSREFNATTCKIKINKVASRSGYEFSHWTDGKNTYISGNTITMNGNKKLKAVWKKKTVSVNTSVNGSGGTVTPSKKSSSGSQTRVVFSPSNGYEIDSVEVNGEEVVVSGNELSLDVEDADINVVVKYREIEGYVSDLGPAVWADVFRLVFDDTAGSSNLPDDQSCIAYIYSGSEQTSTCEVTVPSDIPTRDGYVFLGYGTFEDPNTVIYEPGGTYEINGDVYVMVVWAPIHTLNYDLNGGDGLIESQTCSSNIADGGCIVEISSLRPTKEGSEFFGWATDAEAKTPEYLSGDEISFEAEVDKKTLFAVWVEGKVEWLQGQNYKKGLMMNLVLSIEYPLDDFVSLEIDGTIIDSNKYTLFSGSTVVSIDAEYIDTLDFGEHVLRVNYNNNVVVQTNFVVEDNWDDIYSDFEYVDADAGDDGYDDIDESNSDVDDKNNSDSEDDSDEDVGVPNTGGNINGDNGSSFIQGTFLVLVAISTIVGYRVAKRIYRKESFGFKK